MTVSDQIIAVLDDLAAKVGTTIDWAAENIVPQIELMGEKYVTYELYTSIAWGVWMLVVSLIFYTVAAIMHKKAVGVCYDDERFVSWAAVISWVIFGAVLFSTIMVIGTQIFDIIECCTIPEKVFLEYLKSLLPATVG